MPTCSSGWTGPPAVADGDPPPGFRHRVSDEQLRVFAARTPDERLRWLDETRATLIEMASPETRRRWRVVRGG